MPAVCLSAERLVSPTYPGAVIDLLKRARVPARIEALIGGESLFNDGVGVVIFLVLAGMAGIGGSHAEPGVARAPLLFVREALGGLGFGAPLGGVGYALLGRRPRWRSTVRWRWWPRA